MKLISLNIWGGKAYEPLMKFIKDNAGDTDIFCFQEAFRSSADIIESNGMRANILADIAAALPNFRSFLAPIGSGYDNEGPVDFDITEAQATFIKNGVDCKALTDGSVFVLGKYRRLGKDETIENVPTNFQYVRLSSGGKEFTILNVHGTAYPGHKLDTPERLAQSQKIIEFLRGEDGSPRYSSGGAGGKIVCGDFNLLPETKSIAMIEGAGMTNLIKKFAIERTRSSSSPWYGKPDFQKFADYAFVSAEVNVINFSVPDTAASDHLPLVLEFS
jgi:hypothetical protein